LVHLGITGAIFLSAPTLTWIIRTYDWHMAFLALGIVAAAMVPIWMWLAEEGPIADHIVDLAPGAKEEPLPSYWHLMTNRTMLGLIATNAAHHRDVSPKNSRGARRRARGWHYLRKGLARAP
jgi:predicted MFS family arabinose efflux permease